MSTSSEYFCEVLTEEIPTWMLRPRLESLQNSLIELTRSSFGSAATILVDATSRRLIIHLSNLPAAQADREEEIKGPPKKMAFEADGSPSKALAGFLKKNGAAAADIIDGDDEYVRLRRSVPGRSTAQILQESVPQILSTLRWPKSMRWGTGEHSFIRPIHSVISILDGAPLPISLFGTASGTSTVGHRTLSPGSLTISSFDDYESQLRAAHVVIRADERVDTMRRMAVDLAREAGGTPAVDETIWEQWRYLTEAPALVRSEFPAEYLELPEEVLIMVMRMHQKQLPIMNGGKLTSSFLSVIDNTGDPDGNASSGNAFVTRARFADARFFYETDLKRPLESRLDDLEHLQFHEKLGDYRKKTERIVAIARAICEASGLDADTAARAALLCKADLGTEMVKEFTDLQGRVGGIYARSQGESEAVAQAIYDHYQPVNAEDPLPRTAEGAVVSLADRMDTLCGFFSLGMKPTGSRDPFALRRAAQGIVLILSNRAGWTVPIGVDRLVDAAIKVSGADDSVRTELAEFLAERVRTIFEASPFSFAYDEIAAAMAPGWQSSLTDLMDRAAALRTIRSRPEFLSLLDSSKRIANITAGATASAVRRDLLTDGSEIRLYELSELVGDQISELVTTRTYDVALESFAGMAEPLETFFKDVMVMVDDEAVRANRIALLQRVGSLAGSIADVTKMVVARRDYEKT